MTPARIRPVQIARPLTPPQVYLLRYFAGASLPAKAVRTNQAAYARLRDLGLIVKTEVFPFHVVTTAGRDHLLALARGSAGE